MGSQPPDLGSNPCPLRWQADSQTLGHREVPCRFCFDKKSEAHGVKLLALYHVVELGFEPKNLITRLLFFKLALPLWLHVKGLETVFSFLDVPAQGDPLGKGLLNK